MENNFYTDDFERLLKEKSDEFRMYPSKRVWHSIYNNLYPGRKWPSIAISLVLISTLFFVGYWNSTANNKNYNTKAFIQSNNLAQNNATVLPNGYTNVYSNGNNALPFEDSNAATAIAPVKTGNNLAQIPSYKATTVSKNITHISKNANHINGKINNDNALVKTSATYSNADGKKNIAITQKVAASAIETPIAENITTKIEIIDNITSSSVINPAGTALKNDASIIADAVNQNTINNVIETGGDIVENTEAVKTKQVKKSNSLSTEDKTWVDEYAFYNKPVHKKWKGRLASEIYITPSVGFRSFTSNSNYGLVAATSLSHAVVNTLSNITLNHKPGLSFEAGAGIIISAAKNLRIKAGLQVNFTNYGVEVAPVNHPVSTTILLKDVNTGYPNLQPRTSTVANSSAMPGFFKTLILNQTQQISIPIGVAVKLASNNKLEWYAGASVQPSYVFGGKANLISADHKNYISEPGMISNWNVNTGIETYFHYKMNGYTLQFGPQFRYQLASTYLKQYTYTEKLYNLGMKVGLVKNF